MPCLFYLFLFKFKWLSQLGNFSLQNGFFVRWQIDMIVLNHIDKTFVLHLQYFDLFLTLFYHLLSFFYFLLIDWMVYGTLLVHLLKKLTKLFNRLLFFSNNSQIIKLAGTARFIVDWDIPFDIFLAITLTTHSLLYIFQTSFSATYLATHVGYPSYLFLAFGLLAKIYIIFFSLSYFFADSGGYGLFFAWRNDRVFVYFWTWSIGNNRRIMLVRWGRFDRCCDILTFPFSWFALLLVVGYVHFMSYFHYLLL